METRNHVAQVKQATIASLNAATAGSTDQNRAARFGSWANWNADDIRYLLDELRVGHWNDCGDTVPGYALAMDALALAQSLDFAQGDRDEMVFGGIRTLADTLSHFAEPTDSRDLCEQIVALVDTYRKDRKAKAVQ